MYPLLKYQDAFVLVYRAAQSMNSGSQIRQDESTLDFALTSQVDFKVIVVTLVLLLQLE